jgi:hypothetical protein
VGRVHQRLTIRQSLVVALLALSGCGSLVLPSVEGRLVDRDSEQPIADAEIVQVYRGSGTGGAEPPVVFSRWTRTDSEGSFSFPSKMTSSPRVWFLEVYDPRYDFYHPAYGLVRGPSTDAAYVSLEGSLDQAEQRLMDLQVFCSSKADDPGGAHLRTIACPNRIAR